MDFYLFYLRVQTNEKKLDRDAVVPKIKSDPDLNVPPMVKKPLLGATEAAVIIIDSDDEEAGQAPVAKSVSDTSTKSSTDDNDPIKRPSIIDIVKSDKKLDQMVKVKIEKCPSSLLKRKSSEPSKSNPTISKKLKSIVSSPSAVSPNQSTTTKPVSVPKSSTQPTQTVPVSNFVKKNFSNFAEKLLCLKKNYSSMTENQMVKIFYDLKCGICEMEIDFDSFQELSEHYKQDHDTADLKLECCSVKIPPFLLLSHIRHHMGLEKLSLKQHIQQIQSMFFCHICGKAFAKENWFNVHMKFDHTSGAEESNRSEETNMKSLSCHLCNQTFLKKSYLDCHIKMKHSSYNKSKIACFYCDDTFTHGKHLQSHLAKVHPEKPISSYEKLECKICQKPFNQRSILEAHIFSHMSAEEKKQLKKIKCDLCKFSTLSAHKLRIHKQRLHNKERHKYKCNMCDKTFYFEVKLRIHQVSHLDKDEADKFKPHQCPHCDKHFMYASEVNAHIYNIHRCNICSELLVTAEAYEEHKIKVHNERPSTSKGSMKSKKGWTGNYTCEFCDKNFRQEETYKAHVQEWHLGGYLYECKWCPKKYNDKRSFQEHTKNLHADQL